MGKAINSNVEVPDPLLIGFTLNEPRNVLVGNPVAVRVTLPVNPFNGLTVTVYVVLFPRLIDLEDGLAVMEKSGVAPDTTRVAVTWCVSAPLVPTIVIVYVPAGVRLNVLTLNVEVPDPLVMVIELGLSEAVGPFDTLGDMLITLRSIVPWKLLMGPTVTV